MSESSKSAAILQVITQSAQDTRLLGQALSHFLHTGDLLILEGTLGAGKTTLTQGIGAGLQVGQRVTSPTFIIARTHPGSGGPNLVHVDAYRLEGGDDVDALDLESALENSIVVVEWGSGKVEDLATRVVKLSLSRPEAGVETLSGTVADFPEDTSCRVDFIPLRGDWEFDGLTELWQEYQQKQLQIPGETSSESPAMFGSATPEREE